MALSLSNKFMCRIGYSKKTAIWRTQMLRQGSINATTMAIADFTRALRKSFK